MREPSRLLQPTPHHLSRPGDRVEAEDVVSVPVCALLMANTA
jgi:hypothetical protein